MAEKPLYMDKRERQHRLLDTIIQEYIKTATPVSSKVLAEAAGVDCSSATIRNDMVELEEAGFIEQPHTSAGRIPTEQGYQYYIKNFVASRSLDKRKQEALAHAAHHKQVARVAEERRRKVIARVISELSGEAVIVSLGNDEYYATGLSHLFRKPEFHQQAELLAGVAEVVDQLDEVMSGMTPRTQGVEVFIGQDNPFGQRLSMVVGEYDHDHGQSHTTMGILGPMRMDYDTNIALLEYLELLMNDEYEQKR